MKYLLSTTILLGALALGPSSGAAECLARVEPLDDKDIGYRHREGRCEGLFRAPVAESINLRLIGYHAGIFANKTAGERLHVRILGSEEATDLLLRAVSTRPRMHYTMDTTAIGDHGSFEWRTDVLTHPRVNLRQNELSVLACSNACDEAPETIYWPINLTEDATRSPALSIILQASVELEELFITASSGTESLLDQEPYGNGYFPPDRAIFVPVSFLPAGKARLELVAVSKSGRSDNLVLTLVVP